MFPQFHACPKEVPAHWWLLNSAPITVCCHRPRNTLERFGPMEWFKCISKVITEKYPWFSRCKHLAVKINKLPHPYNYRLPVQMPLQRLPAHPECGDDVSKWSCLAIFDREEAMDIQLNDLVTMSSLCSNRSVKDISSQVNEGLLIQGWNGFVYISSLVYLGRVILFYLPANQSLPVVTSGLNSCQKRKHTFCPLEQVASVCNWEPVIARNAQASSREGKLRGDEEAGAGMHRGGDQRFSIICASVENLL